MSSVVLGRLPTKINTTGLMETAEILKLSNVSLVVERLNVARGRNSYSGRCRPQKRLYYGLTTKENIRLSKSLGGYLICGHIPNDRHMDPETQNASVARMCTESAAAPAEAIGVVEEADGTRTRLVLMPLNLSVKTVFPTKLI